MDGDDVLAADVSESDDTDDNVGSVVMANDPDRQRRPADLHAER